MRQGSKAVEQMLVEAKANCVTERDIANRTHLKFHIIVEAHRGHLAIVNFASTLEIFPFYHGVLHSDGPYGLPYNSCHTLSSNLTVFQGSTQYHEWLATLIVSISFLDLREEFVVVYICVRY